MSDVPVSIAAFLKNWSRLLSGLRRQSVLFCCTPLPLGFSLIRASTKLTQRCFTGTLYLVDAIEPLFSFAPYSSILVHPSLISLTILRADIGDARGFHGALVDHVSSTPLTSLRLEQCHVSTSGLTAMLRAPRELQSLAIIECQDVHSSRKWETLQRGLLFEAMRPQCPFLEDLTLDLVGTGLVRGIPPFNFSDFEVLQNLEVDPFTLTTTFSAGDHLPPHHCRLFPPNIRSLKINSALLFPYLIAVLKLSGGRYPVLGLMQCFLEDKAAYGLEPLETLTLSFLAEEEKDDELKTKILTLGKTSIKNGVRLLITGTTPVQYWQPPFLHGEPLPRVQIEYDSADAADDFGQPLGDAIEETDGNSEYFTPAGTDTEPTAEAFAEGSFEEESTAEFDHQIWPRIDFDSFLTERA